MGLLILSPCSRLSESLALHPTAVCISSATSIVGVMEKNETHKTAQKGGRAARSRVGGKKSIQDEDEERFQGFKAEIKSTNSLSWKHMLGKLCGAPSPLRRYESNFQGKGKQQNTSGGRDGFMPAHSHSTALSSSETFSSKTSRFILATERGPSKKTRGGRGATATPLQHNVLIVPSLVLEVGVFD